jgi:hypothetical protein
MGQRIFASRSADINDHDKLSHDPVSGMLAETDNDARQLCAAAGESTLNRLEHAVKPTSTTRSCRLWNQFPSSVKNAAEAVLGDGWYAHRSNGR